jgi:predicted nucleic acid-binding protein
MYLFDASSIVNLVKRGVVKPLADGVTLDLATYESLNAVWKEQLLLKRLDEDTALEFLDVLSEVFSVMELLSIRGLEREAFQYASKEGLSVYDASYLYMAAKGGLTLVTDDGGLRSRASKHLKTASSKELVEAYQA